MLLVARLSDKYRKDKVYKKSSRLTDDLLELEKLSVNYDYYVYPSLLYFKEDLEGLARRLGAVEVSPKGLYVMGLFGGERRRGAREYAGLALEEVRDLGGKLEFRLHGTEGVLSVSKQWLQSYGVGVYDMIYYENINPFHVLEPLRVLLSSSGGDSLRNFLRKALALAVNEQRLGKDDIDKIRGLIDELVQGKVETLKPGQHYVVYRAERVFVASVFVPDNDRTVIRNDMGYMLLDSPDKAHYYAAVLNYLAYKAVKEGRPLIHHHFGRPLQAIVVSGLEWDSVDANVRTNVVNLSRTISNSNVVRGQFATKDQALLALERVEEFNDLVKALDGVVDRARLEKALELVSGAPSEKN